MTTNNVPPVLPRFNPGTPYDVTQLNKLVDAIGWLNTNSNLGSSTTSAKTEMLSGSEKIPSAGVGAVGATKKMTVTFAAAFQGGIPNVVVTPRFSTGSTAASVTFYVSDVSKTGFSINYMVSKSLASATGIYFNWIAMYTDTTVK